MTKAEIMRAAWELFRKTYRYPSIPFKSIGRSCFGWALKEIYRQERQRKRIAAFPADVKVARIATLKAERVRADYCDSYRTTQNIRAEIDAELARLAA